MSGVYGTVKPADINITEDVEIFYHYRPSINTDDVSFKNFKTLPLSVLTPCFLNDEENISISGLFNLKLPLNEFIIITITGIIYTAAIAVSTI